MLPPTDEPGSVGQAIEQVRRIPDPEWRILSAHASEVAERHA